jgi:hypothetical protein
MVMRDRLLCGFLLLLFVVFPAFGQGGFTTVSGAIVDPNGIPWTGGTITAQLITQGGTAPTLNGQPFSSTTASGLLGPGGTFTMRLGDNGVIVPSTTTWQFTISIAPGVLPPLGKGPQSFTVTTAINCSTNTPSTCTSNAMTITSVLTPVPALSFVSTGVSTPTIVNPSSFGAKGGVKWTTSAVFNNASQHVTCSAGDCGFLATAKVGNIVLCTMFSAYVNGAAFTQTLNCPYGTTITAVNSNTDVTISATPTNNCTPTISLACGFAWGTQDDSTALNAAALAAWGTPGVCGQLQLTDNYFFSSGIFNQTIAQLSSACGGQFGGANVSGIDSTQEGPTLIGSGPGSGVLIPYNFNFATCPSISACMLNAPNLFVDKIGVNGLGQPATGVTAGQQIVTLQGSTGGGSCTGSTLTNSGFANWGVNSNITGVVLGAACGNPVYANNVIEMFGGTPCSFGTGASAINTSYFYNMCFGATQKVLVIQPSGGILNIDGNYIAGMVGNGPVVLYNNTGGGTVNSRSNVYEFQFGASSSSASVFQFSGSGPLQWNSDGDLIFLGSGTTGSSNALSIFGTGATIRLVNTTLTATGTNNRAILLGAGNTLINAGNNTISNGTVANTFTGTTIAQPSETQSGTCAANAATVTFKLVYLVAPLVVVSDTTSASTGAQATSTNTTTATIHCNGATDTFVAAVTPNPI